MDTLASVAASNGALMLDAAGSTLPYTAGSNRAHELDRPHDDLAPQINFTVWFMASLSAAFLGLRVYCKFLRNRSLWWDDHILIAAWVCIFLGSILGTVSTTFGYGKHTWDVPPENVTSLLLVSTFAGFFSTLASVWSKTSFALTLLRISKGWVKGVVWFCLVSMNIAMSATAVLIWTSCTPVQKTWDFSVPGTCLPRGIITHYNTFSAAYSAAMDITLALLPWEILRHLTMNKKEKIAVMLAMSMGVFAGITSIIKTSKIYRIDSVDIFDGVEFVLWGSAEGTVTIMAASIPILRALLRDVPTIPHRPQIRELYPSTSTVSLVAGNDAKELAA